MYFCGFVLIMYNNISAEHYNTGGTSVDSCTQYSIVIMYHF